MAKPSLRSIRNRAHEVGLGLHHLETLLDAFMVDVLSGKLDAQGVALEIEHIRKYLEEVQSRYRYGLLGDLKRAMEKDE